MRVALVAGSEAGHALPALALATALVAAGAHPTVFTGGRWVATGRERGIDTRELPGLAPRPGDDDADAGLKIHARAAHIAARLVPLITELAPDLVVADILTPGGGMAAELVGAPWIELSPHPLYRPSRGLPPIGSGLAPGVNLRGRLRDGILRAFTARDIRVGARQRERARSVVGLPPREPGPDARMIATIPALEVPRPDWPRRCHLVGPLTLEPTDAEIAVPRGDGPLVMVAPSTAATGTAGLAELAAEALAPGVFGQRVRVAVSSLTPPSLEGDWLTSGFGRQDHLVARADAVVCGGGHGMLTKALTAGRPVVTVPGGGDQWELANRVVRQGSGVCVRPATAESLRAAVREVLTDPAHRRAAEKAAATAGRVADPVAVCRTVVRGT
ncbi:glycosyltransferase [Tsukamurella sp. 8F]|uniref:glycosyltransferase n=1 Tax=unclassified Tsukamurella TaxID=2633480 RepID=UPI0023B8F607|nr:MULTISPECIES: nucleotide disphospho-sugar-binding domain-containing protein [unclassified Tsukamurella]MDF0531459.1 glycosyltransferase [Tsukamurella sp. 8J]MDF0587478.1 glycosyltransferase [Tsukamurella sp. 8F]